MATSAFAQNIYPISFPVQNGIISVEVAQYIAEFFIQDMADTGLSTWTENTTVTNIVTMYDEYSNISAYSCELVTNGQDSGYIVISAFDNAVSPIVEYSDEQAPVYAAFNLSENDKVLYTGTLMYYKDSGTNVLETINGTYISKNCVENTLEETRVVQINPHAKSYSTITSPFEYAEEKYGGTYVADYWINEFENYCAFNTTNMVDEDIWYGSCAPVAFSNVVIMLGEYNNISSVVNSTPSAILNNIINYGLNHNYNEPGGGTTVSTLNQYFKEVMGEYDMDISTPVNHYVSDSIVTAILGQHVPTYLGLSYNSIYGSHGVAVYAYTRLKDQSTNQTVSFIKIADGWNTSGRYLEISTLESTNNAVIRSYGL